MKNKIYKSQSLDKYDCYIPKPANFIHDNYYMSGNQTEFHLSNIYAYSRTRYKGSNYGIQKKLWKASSEGYKVDKENNAMGRSDNE